MTTTTIRLDAEALEHAQRALLERIATSLRDTAGIVHALHERSPWPADPLPEDVATSIDILRKELAAMDALGWPTPGEEADR